MYRGETKASHSAQLVARTERAQFAVLYLIIGIRGHQFRALHNATTQSQLIMVITGVKLPRIDEPFGE